MHDKSPIVTATLLLAAVFAMSACGGGGGDGGEEVPVTELTLTDAQRFSLQGDWPIVEGQLPRVFTVRSDVEWNALWAERKAQITCPPSSAEPQNLSFCAVDSPPPVDFARYTLIGILIFSDYSFDEPTPRRVRMEDDGARLRIEYRYIDPSHRGFLTTVNSRFFLVPRTDAALSTDVRVCRFTC